MESALDGAKWLLGKVLNLLTEDLVSGYVASCNLGLHLDDIKYKLMNTQALLHAAQMRGVSDSDSGLQGLLRELHKKADEAEDVLDELRYFRIRDKLDGTNKFDPWVPDDLRGQVVHGRHALCHTVGNCFSCFSCSSTQDDADGVDDILNNPNKARSGNDHDVDHLGRVAMSNNIKLVIEGMQFLCEPISRLLAINTSSNPVGSMCVTVGEQRVTSSITQPIKLYGRDVIFNQTISDMTGGIAHHETLFVLPIFGIGGVGKTTLAQHLYSHKKIEGHFTVRAWVCASTNFDVLRLTKEILDCIPTEKSDDSIRANESNSLDQLQQSIVKRLKSKRFLIVLDDIWECSPCRWEDLLAPLKKSESEKGSMVLVTTRYRGIAQDVKTNNSIHLEGLGPRDIMKLFQDYVFDQAPAGHDLECMIEIAQQIAPKLKGSPLAATTVGRLLKKNFSPDHWKGILERKEWLDGKDADGILPALKISYNYLPFHLKKCFLYFGLFPEDYRFHNLNITQFWIAIGIIDSNDKPEVTGLQYLEEFVDCGFLVKEGDESNPSYTMHDLLHELSQSVSSQECANKRITSLRADDIPESIRHLSITIENSNGDFEEEMHRLKRRVDIGRLRSLMIFGDTSASNIDTILQNTFDEIKRLRVLSIILRSDESCPQNFCKLIHLRYLRISYPYQFITGYNPTVVSLPTTMSTLHNLKFLEINDENLLSLNVPINFSRLVSLRHFIANGGTHSNVPEVGEMKYLQQLKKFHVKKQSDGFELDHLGKLKELGGQLCICGLEKVETMEEASKADLRRKKNLHKLTLEWAWDSMQLDQAADVIDGLEPHPNLRELSIEYHPGAIGPRWLCRDICTTSLESLHLRDISWDVLPPLGLLPRLKELRLSTIAGMSQFGPDLGGVTEKSSASLKTILFQSMPDLVKWDGGANYHFFSRLERIECFNCPQLSGLPFSECTDPFKQETNTVWFPNLCSLSISDCPELSLPPLPHTSTLTDVRVRRKGNPELEYSGITDSLNILGYDGALAFDNLDKVEKIRIRDAPQISLTDFRMLHSLRDLSIDELKIDFLFSADNLVLSSVQMLNVRTFHPIGKLLPRVLKCFPDLSELNMRFFNNEAEYEEQVLPQFPSCSSLSKVRIENCGNLVLPLEDGGGFGGLTSLESLEFSKCGKIFSRWSTRDVSDYRIFPASLRELSACDLFGNCSAAADLFTEVAKSNTLAMGFLGHLEHLRVDIIAAVLVDPVCKLLSAKLRTLKFYCDYRMERFTEEQDKALQQLASLEELKFLECWSLQCLPEGLHGLRSLKRLEVSDCYEIRSLPQNGLPTSLEKLIIKKNSSKELQEEASKLDRGRYPNLVISEYDL